MIIPPSEGFSEKEYSLSEKFETFLHSDSIPATIIATLFDGRGIIAN